MAFYIVSGESFDLATEGGWGIQAGATPTQIWFLVEADTPADAAFIAIGKGYSNPQVDSSPVTDSQDARLERMESIPRAYKVILDEAWVEGAAARAWAEGAPKRQVDPTHIPDFRDDPSYDPSGEAYGPGFVYGGGDNFGGAGRGDSYYSSLPDLFFEGSGIRPTEQDYHGLDILRGLGLEGLIPEEGETIRLLPGTGQEVGNLSSLFRVPTMNTLRGTPAAGIDFLHGAGSRVGLQPGQVERKIRSVTPGGAKPGSVLA